MKTQTVETQAALLDVETYMQRHLPRYLKELKELCAIDSNSYYKPGLDAVATYMAARMQQIGMQVTIIENETVGNDVLGVLKGEGVDNIILLGHIDTVYPVGTAVNRPVKVEDDVVLGPGVCDMKGCILSAAYALEALQAMNYRNFNEIRFLCVSDEEISQRHSEELIRRVAQGCTRSLVLEAGRANGDIVSARKGGAWYTLTAKGRAAHTGVEPEKGRNAIVEVMHQTLQFLTLDGWREGLTINPGVITGGLTPNVIPDYAQVRFDLRHLRVADRIDTEEKWHEMLQHKRIPDVELTLEREPYRKEPMECTPDARRLALQAQELAAVLGFSLNHTLTGGASDASFTSELGIPTLDGLGPVGGSDHSPSEYIIKSSIAPRVALLAGLIMSTDA